MFLTKLLRSQKTFFFLLLFFVCVFFLLYFQPLKNDFPLPALRTKEFFNTTFSDYFFYSRQLNRNIFPIWNPYKGGGSTFLGELQQNLFNPINLLFLKAVPFPQNLKFLYLVAILTAVFGSFFYLQSLGNKPAPAFLGATLFAFSGHLISQISDFPHLQAISFLPWLFWGCHRLITKPNLRNAAIVALTLALQALSGPIGFTFSSWLLVFLYTFILLFYIEPKLHAPKGNTKKIKQSVAYSLVAITLGLGVSAIKLLPLRELTLSGKNGLILFYSLSYPFRDFLSLVEPTTRANSPIFIGLTPFLSIVIILALFRKRLKRTFPLFLYNILAGLLCLSLIMPKHSPSNILYLFPPFSLVATPLVFASFFTWFLMIIFTFLLNFLFRLKKFSLLAVLGVLTMVELTFFNLHHLPSQTAQPLITSLEKDFPFIKKIGEEGKKIWFINPRPTNDIFPLEANNNLLWEVKSLNANFAGSQRHRLLLSLIYQGIEFDREKGQLSFSPASQKLLALQSVNYLVTPVGITDLEPLVQQSGLNFYPVPAPVPERRLVDNFIIVETQKGLADSLRSEEFDGSSSAVLEKRLSTTQAVIISQEYLPGWQAEFNHQMKIDIQPANLNQQALPLNNQIASEPLLSFSPYSLKVGITLSLVSLILCLMMMLGNYKAEKSPSSNLFFRK